MEFFWHKHYWSLSSDLDVLVSESSSRNSTVNISTGFKNKTVLWIFLSLFVISVVRMNKPHTPTARPTFEIDLNEKIICFDSSLSSIHSENIILLGFKRRILILALDNSEGEYNFDYKKIRDIPESEVRILKLCSSIIVRYKSRIFYTMSNCSGTYE